MRERVDIGFGLLNLAQGAFTITLPLALPALQAWINAALFAAGGAMIASGLALLLFGRRGHVIAGIACLLHGGVGTLFAALTISAGAYLYTVYGDRGETLGLIAYVMAFITLVHFWLLPAHELYRLVRR